MMKKSKIIGLTICCVLFIALSVTVSAEESDQKILNDSECDVYDLSDTSQMLTGTETDELTSMDLKTTCKPNIDIIKITCEKNNEELTIDLEVNGEIEDGTSMDKLEDIAELLNNTEDMADAASSLTEDIIQIQYIIMVNTTADQYIITYSGGNCTVSNGSVDMFAMSSGEDAPYQKTEHGFSVTTTIGKNEEIENITAYTIYMRAGLLALLGYGDDLEYYMDVAPNLGFTASAIANPQQAKVDEEIQFSSSVIEGVEPYDYEWDFGDGSTADIKNPTHKYSKEGKYEVNLLVTDSIGNTTEATIEVNITNGAGTSQDGGSSLDKNNDNNGFLAATFGENSGLVAFIALVAAILIVGLAVLYYISKR